MQFKLLKDPISYDGSQLRSLYAYMDHHILGDSMVAWVGPCDIPFEHMADGEDLLAKAQIKGDKMVHFIIEKFNISLFSGVSLQRLLASVCIEVLQELSPVEEKAQMLIREGDDIYFDEQKLSISIATQSPVSTLIHFAVNVTNQGTPVKTLSLEDLKVDAYEFAKVILHRFSQEIDTIDVATKKVRWVK
ncbi:MAG: DUF366 family protein [Bdellovibrionales bacterium]|nr:DUF366 family protein [Bdellovibrionales bacterium]